MSLLGNVGYLYLNILIILMVLGLGSAGYWAINMVIQLLNNKKVMQMDWFKIALLSFLGIVVLFLLQQIITTRQQNPRNYGMNLPVNYYNGTYYNQGQTQNHSQHH